MRSLSCEVASREGGAILFSTGTPEGEGNNSIFYCIQEYFVYFEYFIDILTGHEWGIASYVFRVADGQARGHSRMYSILVILSDVTLLVHSFTWLSGSLRALVNELMARAKKHAAVATQQQVPTYDLYAVMMRV